jgi:para-aminobenzoate synthetase/4-amino-4-deoxychorismate lyase
MALSAVLQDGVPGRWLAFAAPRAVVEARTLAAVAPALAEVARRVEADGLWAVGFVAYEAAPACEPALVVRTPGAGAPPLLRFALTAPPRRVEAPAPPFADDLTAADGSPGHRVGAWQPSVSRDVYRRAVDEIRRRIARGDTYQVNYTYHLRAPFEGDPRSLFADLVAAQGGGYGGFVDAGRHAVCCASPELFFDLEDGFVTTRPMKGTAPRGRWSEEDEERARELAASAKERAENLMIVDMMRNDLGRVATAGSVEVPRLFKVERYPTVWQMTSTVTARLAPGVGLPELFAALFPCASITGAPKASTSRIIAELESGPRGVYTGAVGWMAPGRRARFAVAIRTAVVDRERGEAEYGVGGGIVWDSRPEREAAETEVKARVLTAPPRPSFELLETMLWTPPVDAGPLLDGVFLLAGHLGRLAGSAAYFGFYCDPEAVRWALATAVEAALRRISGEDERPTEALRLRLLLARDGAVRIETSPLAFAELGAPSRRQADAGEALPVALAPRPADASDVFLFHKTTHRTVYDDALAEVRRRHPEAAEAILVNGAGEVTETTTANVVAALDGALVTPPLAAGCLPGVYRRHLLESGEITEAPVRVDDLVRSDGLWLVNSLRRWRRARLVAR